MPRTFTYQEDGTVICDVCHQIVCKVPGPHWRRMQKWMAEGKKPFTDTLTWGATLNHIDKCPIKPTDEELQRHANEVGVFETPDSRTFEPEIKSEES